MEDNNLIFDHFGEIEAWVVNGKEYYWNGGFHVPMHELKKLSINQLPLNERVQPLDQENEDYIVPSFPDLHLIRTPSGIVVNVESVFHRKFWSHKVVSMQCFVDSLLEEIKSNKEFQLNDFDNKDQGNVYIEYETRLIDVQSISEAIKLAVHSLKALERRVNWRIAEKVRTWAREIKP